MLLTMTSNDRPATSEDAAKIGKSDTLVKSPGSNSSVANNSGNSKDVTNKESSSGAKANDVDFDDDVTMTFPQRLMEILDNEDNSEIITWLPHGHGFVILRKKAFEARVLPKYFNKQSKYSSFTRKLNRWGFCRVTRGPESGAYYHQFFRRGGHRLVMQMSCQSSNKGAAAGTSAIPTPNYLSLGATGFPSSVMNPQFSLQSMTAEQAIGQQQQQMLQLQNQQQMLQQEMFRRAMMSQQQMQHLTLPGSQSHNQPVVTPNFGPSATLSQASLMQQFAGSPSGGNSGDMTMLNSLAWKN